MEVDENFYDEFSSFLPAPDDYNLDELDEILRSTDTQLDSSIDFSTLVPPDNVPNFQIEAKDSQPLNEAQFNFNAYPSPAATAESYGHSPYDTHCTSSTSSSSTAEEEENFNPDDFINFLNDDDLKMELSSPEDSGLDASSTHRGTPSPTGSCNSSIDSATSGVQSDVSSVASSQDFSATISNLKQESQMECVSEFECKYTPPVSPVAPLNTKTETPLSPQPASISITSTAAILPVTLPVLSVQPTTAVNPATPRIQTATTQLPPGSLNVLQGTLIPVKTMPITSVTSIQVPTPVKIEPKLAPKIITIPAKTTTTAISAAAKTTTPTTTTSTNPLPTNSKPKTIFLSTNDFKALMQKLNNNGKGGTKISGNINGQMPKIVMKTTNGQVINSKKTITQFVPKSVLKSATPLIIKQDPAVEAATIKAACTNTTLLRPPMASVAPNINIYKGIVDEKTMKKQQRMIKNRESASLSRKKKKEYVVSLESRISDLEKENITLKGENTSLRSQLVAFAQHCKCKHSNISDFILNSLSVNSTQDGITYRTEDHQHVRIAPKPAPASSNKGIKQRLLSASIKKNVAVLFAMAFMVILNIGGFQSFLARSALENAALESGAEENVASAASVNAAGRRLLWVESESEFNDAKLNRTKRDTELQVPPLHFLRPNRTEAKTAAEQLKIDGLPSSSSGSSSSSKCPMSTNQTENQRLARNLHKWIGGNDYLNLSKTHAKFDENPHVGFKLKPDYFELKTYDLPLQRPPGLAPSVAASRPEKRKQHYFQRAELHDDASKQRKFDDTTTGANVKNSLDLFKPKISDEYLRLFKGIKRQADTFYVLSFNMEHILLPASAYNKSSRPKMALMLPAGDPSINGDIVLMQIDCEVVNTTEVQLKSDMIPEKLRPTKFTANSNDVANNETGTTQTSTHAAGNKKPTETANRTNAHTAPRPYFMDKQNNKQQATVFRQNLQQQPTRRNIVNQSEDKLETLDSAHVSRNTSLFERMRGTIEFLP